MAAALSWTRCILVAIPLLMSPLRVAGASAPTTAERQFEKGRALLKAGDCSRAVVHFRESQRLDPAPGTLMNLATCEAELGQVSRAWQHFGQAIELLPEGDPRLAFAKAKQSEIGERVGWLELSLPESAPNGTRVITREIPMEVLKPYGAIPLDPGKRQLMVDAPGHRVKVYDIEIPPGQTRSLAVELGAPLRDAVEGGWRGARSGGFPMWASFAVGGVGLGSGVATSLMLSERRNTVRQHCDAEMRTCNAEGLQAARQGESLLPINAVSYGVGALGFGLGTFFLISESGDSQISVKERPSGALIEYRQKF